MTQFNISFDSTNLVQLMIAIDFFELTNDWSQEIDQNKIILYQSLFHQLSENQNDLFHTKKHLTNSSRIAELKYEFKQQIHKLQMTYEKENLRRLIQSIFLKMHLLFDIEESQEIKIANRHPERFSFFRSFDFIDDLIGIDYRVDTEKRNISLNTERLYEGAGVGVQTSYSTLYQVFKNVHFPKCASVIDLGSGYGRLGFYLDILRPDIHFTGYEYIQERVSQANLNLIKIHSKSNNQFLTQDLSDKNFQLPNADFYYLYDPFTEATYNFIMKQLVELSKQKNITIISKGNSKSWLRMIQQEMPGYQIRSLDNDHIVVIEKQ